MNLQALRKCLLPNEAEQDEGFRQEILRLSHQSLRIIAAVQAGAAVAITLAHFAVERAPGTVGVRLLQSGIMIALGGFLLAMYRFPQPMSGRGRLRWRRRSPRVVRLGHQAGLGLQRHHEATRVLRRLSRHGDGRLAL